MVVGVLRVVLALPGNNSLKGKRKVVRSALDRVRARFNVAAAEVEYLDDWRRASLAFAVVSNDHSHANSMLDTIAGFVSTSVDAVVTDRALEIIPLGTMGGSGEDWGQS
ncbi:MAG: DUF503 domain-containing protein [Myxococcales bacterium]|nr:DUF503 domain-containing protein [Myxococcales bacterium]MDD9968951.1 DUF503 domain-containing protein [Myxococcales bacterium]